MEPLSQNTQKQLQELGVNLVYLFGSYAEGKEMPHSDVDIGVVFERVPSPAKSGAMYQRFYELFTNIFSEKKVDVVFVQRAGLELCFDVISHGKLLFESTKGKHYDFEEQTTIMYTDFAPIRQEFDRAMLARIGREPYGASGEI